MKRLFRFVKALYKYMVCGNKIKLNDFTIRINFCRYCDYVDFEKYMCKKCGCYLLKKCRMSSEHCPIKKW